ncbi:DUF4362 domain-containing protein [Sporosarcina highlanderae]|uniref:DUF4362 domain-containing protein n=1 Tax=Sporosarcina highlanderae TaxID=3035916 RepID=A0ABT8JV12_9BACL|nr:DUF4362 domain-containing protein [Sporosarcina highlanderae]MDN4609008.1 DUF4362 domain-containing protein [Sporosarcina highlanderae]
MRRILFLVAVLCFALLGCTQGSSNQLEEVVNNHNDIENLEGLDRFVENVENQNGAKINYIQYGVEGQRGVKTLTFDGKSINVSQSVAGEFIEEYNCQGLTIEIEKDIKQYILRDCSGSFNGDFVLLSIPNK